MNDDLKFEAFKEDQILKNTNEYGDELNKNYGKEFIKKSNRKYKNKTSEEFKVHDELTKKLNETMKKAIIEGNPSSDLSMKMCQIHKEWLMFYWPSYDKNHHLSLTEMYTLDDRFRKYYDDISEGLSDFLYKAMKLFVNK